MEIEATFRVDDRSIFATLLSLPTLGDATLIPHAAPELQHTVYFDTPDEMLHSRGMSLRVRQIAGQRIATVKCSHRAGGGLHIRDEWETPINTAVHPYHWPPSPAREQALAVVGWTALVARVTVHTRRHRINVQMAGHLVAEVCLDEGHIVADRRRTAFRDLEVELLEMGTLAHLERLCALLTRQFPLAPESRGKRTRGLALLETFAAAPRARSAARVISKGSLIDAGRSR